MKIYTVHNYEPGAPEDNELFGAFKTENDALNWIRKVAHDQGELMVDEVLELEGQELMEAAGYYFEESEVCTYPVDWEKLAEREEHDMEVEAEKQRKSAVRRQQVAAKKRAAMAKLSPEDKKALGL